MHILIFFNTPHRRRAQNIKLYLGKYVHHNKVTIVECNVNDTEITLPYNVK